MSIKEGNDFTTFTKKPLFLCFDISRSLSLNHMDYKQAFSNYLQLNPLLRIAILLMAGIVAGEYCPLPITSWIALYGLSLLLTLVCKAKLQGAALLLNSFLLGALLLSFYHYRHDRPLPTGEIAYKAVITTTPQVRGKVMRCDLLVTEMEGKTLKRPMKIKASMLRHDDNHDRQLRIANEIIPQPPITFKKNTRSNAHFDYRRWLQIHGYEGTTFIPYWKYHTAAFQLSLSRLTKSRLTALCFRERLAKELNHSSLDKEAQSLLLAMTLGDKSQLSKQTRDDFSRTGSSHILALSGLHLSIIYFILITLLGRHIAGTILSLLTIWAYAMMVGLQPSVVRAATMITIYGLLSPLNRDKMSMNTLSLTAIIMLAVHPLSLWDTGFQLSFLAVTGIFAYARPLSRLFRADIRPLRGIAQLMATSLAAQIATAPLVLHYFGRFACYFLLTNLIVIPLATLILYTTAAVFLTTLFGLPHGLLLKAAASLTDLLSTAIKQIATLPGASIDNIYLSNREACLCYLGIIGATIAAFLWREKQISRRLRTKDLRVQPSKVSD